MRLRANAMGEIPFYCVFCGIRIDADPKHKVYECPNCLHFTPVPPVSGRQSSLWPETYPSDIISVEIKFPCPECDERLIVDARNAGKAGYCPLCSTEIQCPHLSFLIVPEPGPKKDGAPTAIHLSPEEIDFLSPHESSHGKTALHAS